MNPLADPKLTDALTGVFRLVVPEVALVGAACVLFLAGLFVRGRAVHFALALAGLAAAAVLAVVFHREDVDAFAADGLVSPVLPGPAAVFVRWLVLGLGLLFLLVSTKEVGGAAADYYACLLVALAGTSLVARANDLVSLFLALEMISIPTYVLLYLPARTKPAQEAAVKYFLLSVLSSAVFLFGLSYLYGLAGSTNLTAIEAALTAGNKGAVSPLAVLAVVLAVAGLGFRVTAVPFHYYAPDVYQGGPTGVVTQLAVLPKVAGFVALARLLGLTTPPLSEVPFPAATQVPLLLWVLAAVTMTVGNVLALLQDNLKRLLAYSGVAHGGYMLLGLLAANAYAPTAPTAPAAGPEYVNGLDALLFYLVAYALMTVGAFAVIVYLNWPDRPVETVDDLAGAGQTHPVAAGLLAVSLLSLIGLPLTAGFAGKLLLFFGVFEAPTTTGMGNWYRVLAVVGAVNAAIGAVYYLRLLGVLYLRSPLRPAEPATGFGPLLAAVLCAVGTVLAGVYPKALSDAARLAAPVTAAKAVATAGR